LITHNFTINVISFQGKNQKDISINYVDFKIVSSARYGAGSHPVPRMVQGRNDTV